MKRALILSVVLGSAPALAATPIDGWYGSVFGGYTYIPDNVSATTSNGLLLNGTSYRNGYNAGGRFGYKSNPLRYEGEYTYLHANVKHFNLNNINQINNSGYNSASYFMANIYYDFPEMIPCFTPFLGVGIGYAHVVASLQSLSNNFGYTTFKATNNVFAYQGTTGFSYNFAENWSADLAYRYTATQRPSQFGKVFQTHIASLGVTYRFNEAIYK